LEEINVLADHKVLKKVDNNISLIVADPQWILGQATQASPNPLIKYCYSNFNQIKLFNI